MRLRLPAAGLAIALISAAVVGFAQPPNPPSTPPSMPPSSPPTLLLNQPPMTPPPIAVPPSLAEKTTNELPATMRTTDSPLSRFENLALFPGQTQSAVRSVLLSATWLTRMNQSHGRFIFGFNPALRQPLLRDHDLYQARAALAMAQLARFTGDEKQAVIASQAILTLLSTTKIDPAAPNCRVPLHSSLVCNRVGFAATLAMAIYALPTPDGKLLDAAEQLAEFLHRQCRPDGSIHYTDGATANSLETDPTGVREYPGLAFQAIMMGNRIRPAAWKPEVTRKGLAFYQSLVQSEHHPLLAATLTPGFAELFLQAHVNDAANFVFDLNDYLCRFLIPTNDQRIPQWAGGIRTVQNGQQTDVPSGPETGFYLQSLSYARLLARVMPDLDRHPKYRAASQDAALYLTELQYTVANTQHFENAFRVNMLIGGFHLSPTDGNIRIDATGTAVTGLLQFLGVAVERD